MRVERVKEGTVVLWTNEVGRGGVAQGHLAFDLQTVFSKMFSPDHGQPSPWEEAPHLSTCSNSHSHLLRKYFLVRSSIRLPLGRGAALSNPCFCPSISTTPCTPNMTPFQHPLLLGSQARLECHFPSQDLVHHHPLSPAFLAPPSSPHSWLGRAQAHNSSSITLPAISAGTLVTRS